MIDIEVRYEVHEFNPPLTRSGDLKEGVAEIFGQSSDTKLGSPRVSLGYIQQETGGDSSEPIVKIIVRVKDPKGPEVKAEEIKHLAADIYDLEASQIRVLIISFLAWA